MKRLILLFALGCVYGYCAGCARFSTIQTDISPSRTITTRATAYTFFSANNKLATWKASQTDKTQGASVGGLEQAATGSNVVSVIEAMADLARAIKGLP